MTYFRQIFSSRNPMDSKSSSGWTSATRIVPLGQVLLLDRLYFRWHQVTPPQSTSRGWHALVVIPGALADMSIPLIHPERRMNIGGPLTAYEDELPYCTRHRRHFIFPTW